MDIGSREIGHLVITFRSADLSTQCTVPIDPRSWRGVLDTTLCDKVCQ